MGSCYSVDHIAEDHKHMDMNTEGPQQKYRLETVSSRLLEEGWDLNMFYWLPTLALSFRSASNIGPHEGFLTHK